MPSMYWVQEDKSQILTKVEKKERSSVTCGHHGVFALALVCIPLDLPAIQNKKSYYIKCLFASATKS